MTARVQLGWVTEEQLAQDAAAEEEANAETDEESEA
jgi:N utilization substance protein A